MGSNSGPPMRPGSYNNNVQILQIPGYVVLVNEHIHNTRIIPVDGRPHGNIRQWVGDSRGRWDGETLVIETKNFQRETNFAGSSKDTLLVERFRRVDPDTLMYEFTIEDPNNYTRSWTAMIPLRRTDGPLFEYALPRRQLRDGRHHGRRPQLEHAGGRGVPVGRDLFGPNPPAARRGRRKVIMRRFVLSLAAIAAASLLAAPASLQEREVTGSSPYDVVDGWMQPFAAAGYAWGSHPGVFAESPDRIFVIQRGVFRLPDPVPPGVRRIRRLNRSQRTQTR